MCACVTAGIREVCSWLVIQCLEDLLVPPEPARSGGECTHVLRRATHRAVLLRFPIKGPCAPGLPLCQVPRAQARVRGLGPAGLSPPARTLRQQGHGIREDSAAGVIKIKVALTTGALLSSDIFI